MENTYKLKTILLNDRCDETLNFQFFNTSDAVEKLNHYWKEVELILESNKGWKLRILQK